MDKSTDYMAKDYYRRIAAIEDAEMESKTTQISYRIPIHQLEGLDKMAKYFGQTRSGFLNDLIHSALNDFYRRFIQECYQAGDEAACNAFLEAQGHTPEAADIFESIRRNGGTLA